MQGILDALTTAGGLVLDGCAQGMGAFCALVSAVMAYRFPLGVLLLVVPVAGALIVAELHGYHHGHRAPEPPRRT